MASLPGVHRGSGSVGFHGMGFGAGPGCFRSALAGALLDGDHAGARQMLHPQFQSTLTAERLGQVWQLALDQIGDPGPVSVSCRSQPGGVAAVVTFAGSQERLSLLIRFTASGQIAMLRFSSQRKCCPGDDASKG